MVEQKETSPRLSPEDEKYFPSLCISGYRVSSEKTSSHNCIAYAAGDKTRKWAQTAIPGYYWPPGALRGDHPDALRSAFEVIGYIICSDDILEAGFEKIALYIDSKGLWTHASKQEANGEWSCKLGDEEDIHHNSPHCFEDSLYGKVDYFMKRKMISIGEPIVEERQKAEAAKTQEPPTTNPS